MQSSFDIAKSVDLLWPLVISERLYVTSIISA